jgi:hypothetical protein
MVDYNTAESIQPLPRNIYLFLNNVFALLILVLCVGNVATALESETSKVTVFRQLSEAKSISDLPVKFREILVSGQREALSEMLFDSGMKKTDVEDYLKYLCPKPGKAPETIISYFREINPQDKADPLYYMHIKEIPMRYLIKPMRFLILERVRGSAAFSFTWVPLAIDHRGIIIVGYKEYENYKMDPELLKEREKYKIEEDTFPFPWRVMPENK